MLTYINENFLHAPSTDLGREVVHLLINLLMAQSTEVFTAKLMDERKSPGLVCRSANSAAAMYIGLTEEIQQFQGKGIFDRNWLYIVTIKAKLFSSVAQYYRSLADKGGGAALVRLKMASTLASEAAKQAASFSYGYYATPTLPADAGTSLVEITKAHAALCTEAAAQAVRDNELIYHDILPSEAALPAIEKLPAATPITIQEVYANPDVSKLIGPDIFARLIPLAVHESASVYSEEKAKVIRGEVERVDANEGEIRAALDHLGLPRVMDQLRSLLDGEETIECDLPPTDCTDPTADLRRLDGSRESCRRQLNDLVSLLDNESRECERMRVSHCPRVLIQAKHAPQITQPPSNTGHFRSNITSNLEALSAAANSDERLNQLWREIAPDIAILAQGNLQAIAQRIAAGSEPATPGATPSLLDLDDNPYSPSSATPLSPDSITTLGQIISSTHQHLDRLGKVRRERDQVLKDLKEKVSWM